MGQRVEGVIFKQLTCQPLLHPWLCLGWYVTPSLAGPLLGFSSRWWAVCHALKSPLCFAGVGRGLHGIPWVFPAHQRSYYQYFSLKCVFHSHIRLQLIFNPRENTSSHMAFVRDRVPCLSWFWELGLRSNIQIIASFIFLFWLPR